MGEGAFSIVKSVFLTTVAEAPLRGWWPWGLALTWRALGCNPLSLRRCGSLRGLRRRGPRRCLCGQGSPAPQPHRPGPAWPGPSRARFLQRASLPRFPLSSFSGATARDAVSAALFQEGPRGVFIHTPDFDLSPKLVHLLWGQACCRLAPRNGTVVFEGVWVARPMSAG